MFWKVSSSAISTSSQGGKADDVAALYAEDATLEDPVGGGEVHIGRQAIAGFYKVMEAGEIKT